MSNSDEDGSLTEEDLSEEEISSSQEEEGSFSEEEAAEEEWSEESSTEERSFSEEEEAEEQVRPPLPPLKVPESRPVAVARRAVIAPPVPAVPRPLVSVPKGPPVPAPSRLSTPTPARVPAPPTVRPTKPAGRLNVISGPLAGVVYQAPAVQTTKLSTGAAPIPRAGALAPAPTNIVAPLFTEGPSAPSLPALLEGGAEDLLQQEEGESDKFYRSRRDITQVLLARGGSSRAIEDGRLLTNKLHYGVAYDPDTERRLASYYYT